MPSPSTRKKEPTKLHHRSPFNDRPNKGFTRKTYENAYKRFSNLIKPDPKTLTVQFTQTRQGVNGREQKVTVQQEFNDQDELKSFLKDIENLMLTKRKTKRKSGHRSSEYVVVEEPDEIGCNYRSKKDENVSNDSDRQAKRPESATSSEFGCEFRSQAPNVSGLPQNPKLKKSKAPPKYQKPKVYKTFEKPILVRQRPNRRSMYMMNNVSDPAIDECYYFGSGNSINMFQRSKSMCSRQIYNKSFERIIEPSTIPPTRYNRPFEQFQVPYDRLTDGRQRSMMMLANQKPIYNSLANQCGPSHSFRQQTSNYAYFDRHQHRYHHQQPNHTMLI